MHYFIGFDLGRDRDHSALAILTLADKPLEQPDYVRFAKTRPVLELGFLKRIPLGTEYLSVLDTVKKLIRQLHGESHGTRTAIQLIVDSGGPGPVPVEMLKRAQLNAQVIPVIITAGESTNPLPNGRFGVPRKELIGTVSLLLETGNLQIARNLYWKAELERELAAVRHDGKQKDHDDLVIAVGLAAWRAVRVYPALAKVPRAA